jgi:hypothetical protein
MDETKSTRNNGWSDAAAFYVRLVGPCMVPYVGEVMRLLDGSTDGKHILEVGAELVGMGLKRLNQVQLQ